MMAPAGSAWVLSPNSGRARARCVSSGTSWSRGPGCQVWPDNPVWRQGHFRIPAIMLSVSISWSLSFLWRIFFFFLIWVFGLELRLIRSFTMSAGGVCKTVMFICQKNHKSPAGAILCLYIFYTRVLTFLLGIQCWILGICVFLDAAFPGKAVFFLVALNGDCDGSHAYDGDDDAQYYGPANAASSGLV